MTRYLYEKDLRPMKYTILTSTKHDRTVREVAHRLGMADAKLRMAMIRRLDMSLLENLESRWEMGQKHADGGDGVAGELGCELFTRFIPLLDTETMQSICDETTTMIQNGLAVDDAITRGRERIRKAVLR